MVDLISCLPRIAAIDGQYPVAFIAARGQSRSVVGHVATLPQSMLKAFGSPMFFFRPMPKRRIIPCDAAKKCRVSSYCTGHFVHLLLPYYSGLTIFRLDHKLTELSCTVSNSQYRFIFR